MNSINEQKGKLIKKKHEFEKKFNIDNTDKSMNYLLKDNGKIYCYNKKKIIFEGYYEVIGTVNEKTCYYRWAWANPSIPNKSLNFVKNMISYGEDKKIAYFLSPKLKGKIYGFKSLILASYINEKYDTYLVYKKPRTSLIIYLLIRNSKKPTISYTKFLKNELNM